MTATLTVGLLTFRRPADLAEVLPQVLAQLETLTGAGRAPVHADVLVVDNDAAASARTVAVGLADPRVRYVVEPVPGIAAARNRVLDECAQRDLLVFLDDDERPHPGWLPALLSEHARSGAAGVAGPVVSDFTGTLDPWIAAGGYFERRRPPTGTSVSTAATNNLLLDLRVVRARGLRFDTALGLTGGSDTAFTRALTRGGDRIVWCAEAVVTDRVPVDRMTRRWVLTRARRSGASSTAVDLRLAAGRRQRNRVRVRGIGAGVPRLVLGGARAGLGTVTRSRTHQARGLRSAARGLGMLTGVLGHIPEEYRR